MRDEREQLLRAGTPAEWRKWLKDIIKREVEYEEDDYDVESPYLCMFCVAYGHPGALGQDVAPGETPAWEQTCGRCIPGAENIAQCNYNYKTREEKIEAAKKRLSEAGLWP